ncbi:MAG: indole-3-glycerol phosphate synthase TrpC [Treponema sp.]|jgi:indole-3-glycerol phosphate synthase|nr:indole-3-glycerol phosphate synthase TrpC [Treponema sp.]
MSTILDAIAAHAHERVQAAAATLPFAELEALALSRREGKPQFAFEHALRAPGLSLVCEVKKASPSKGVIAEDFPYLQIAKEYEKAGAQAVSVLTEPKYFLGSDEYLREIAATIKIPTLRKDFVVDRRQVYEAAALGAEAVLLICAILDRNTLAQCLRDCDRLGVSALVETRSEADILAAVDAGARVIGVNNRDLRTFQVDLGTSARLRRFIPDSAIFVSESGVKTYADIRALMEHGAGEHALDAALIGESCMRSSDKARYLAELRGAEGNAE